MQRVSECTDVNQQNRSARGGDGNCDNLLEMCRAGDGSDKPLKISPNGDGRDGERRHLAAQREQDA